MFTIKESSSPESSTCSSDLKTRSAPIIPLQPTTDAACPVEIKVKPQVSAPFYLFSLKENESPPFNKPGRQVKPKLLYNTLMSDHQAVEMIATASEEDGLRKYLGAFLVEKKITENSNLSENNFLISFVTETIEYAAQRDFSASKLACVITIYLNTHLYFKSYFRLSADVIWGYFKETMILHTIEDFPYGKEVFEPEECYDILSHFLTTYMSNLPLIHILTFGVHRLKLSWPFNYTNTETTQGRGKSSIMHRKETLVSK